ncbi:MAG TPA: OPT/YSL family transporter [Phycisphaerales bacterium]|nr:OPT/YSL family transporter [Phycisphaerales bacterium]
MAIKQLSEEQVRTWSLEEKDRWWLENVFRGNMPQLTIRSAVTGFLLGGLLSATNLYVGAKTGWTLGVGLTSVILAFAAFRILARLGARDFTILENNAMQSVATAAGYMTGPLTSGMAAYMWVQNELLPWWQMLLFNVVLSVLGVLVAFPLKRRFINDEQQPFPEGRACGVVLDTLYTSDASVGMFQARALTLAALAAGTLKLISSEASMTFVQGKLLGLRTIRWLNEHLDAWYYDLVDQGRATAPHVLGTKLRDMGVSPGLDLAMVGAGGLMGIRPALNMFLGMVLNFLVIVPIMVHQGEIRPRPPEVLAARPGLLPIDRIWALNTWALWWGISIMVVAALTALFARPQIITSAFRGLLAPRGRAGAAASPMAGIELPLWVSLVGIPIVGAIGVWMAAAWFDVKWYHGAAAIPLIMALTLIAVNSTALTGITPTGSVSKIPQFLFGSLRPKHPGTNLMTAVMCVEVASNASNLLMDIKPGYMLGAKPRQQALGHLIGILAGALASTPLFYLLFLNSYEPGENVQEVMLESGQFGFPSALQWRGISDLISNGFGSMPRSAQWSMAIAAIVGVVFEVVRIRSRNRFPLSPLAIGLGVVIPPESTLAMLFGAAFFWALGRAYTRRGENQGGAGAEHGRVEGQLPSPRLSLGERLWVTGREPICAGLIAGAALVGIADILIRAFLL